VYALNGTTFVRVTVQLNFQWAFRAEPFSLYNIGTYIDILF